MELIRDPIELGRKFNAFVYGSDVPEVARDRLQSIPGVLADVIVEGTEILYAHFDLLSPAGKEVLGLFAAYGVDSGWSGHNVDGRWEKIRDRVRHDLGDPVDLIADEDMPEPQTTRREDGKDWRVPSTPAPEE